MSYRVLKKATQRNQNACLKCKYCQIVRKFLNMKDEEETIVTCNAPDKAFYTASFNTKYFVCVEVKSINTLTQSELEKIKPKPIKRITDKYALTEPDEKKATQLTLF